MSFRPEFLGLGSQIQNGKVLDQRNRPIWSLTQAAQFMLETDVVFDALYVDDFFHAGIEGIAYDVQSARGVRIASFCWAQSFDRYDFTAGSEYGRWMRKYEEMACEIYDTIFVANDMLAELINTTLPHLEDKVRVVGLPFSSEVAQIETEDVLPEVDRIDVVYSSRLDTEKNAEMLPDIIRQLGKDYVVAIVTGHLTLKSNILGLENELRAMQVEYPNLHLLTGLTKKQYYGILKKSVVQLNTSLQDWVSFTLLEALSFDCKPVYPLGRSFVQEFTQRGVDGREYCYCDITDVTEIVKRIKFVHEGKPEVELQQLKVILDYHCGTLDRIGNILTKGL